MEEYKTTKGEKRFRDKIWVNGSLIKSSSFHKKTDCIKWKAEQISNKAKQQVYGDNKLHVKITFAEFSERWLAAKTAADLARATLKKYKDFCRVHFIPEFGSCDLKSIQKSDIQDFQLKLRKTHNAKGTNLIMTGLKSVFNEAIKEEYLIKSPCAFVKNLSVDKRLPAFWTEADINQFQKYTKSHEYYNLITFAINTGLRKGELAALCWDRINFDEGLIIISRTRDKDEFKERTKPNQIRVMPMSEICRAILLNLHQQNKDKSKFVFLDKLDDPFKPHHISRLLRDLQKKAGIKNEIRFHDLRHTFASLYIKDGRSIYDLQKLLGHSTVVMTENYAHHSKDHLQNAVKGFRLGKLDE